MAFVSRTPSSVSSQAKVENVEVTTVAKAAAKAAAETRVGDGGGEAVEATAVVETAVVTVVVRAVDVGFFLSRLWPVASARPRASAASLPMALPWMGLMSAQEGGLRG